MNHLSQPTQAALLIKKTHPNFKPKIGIVLGSGLGCFTKIITNSYRISYNLLPGFPKLTVTGHAGNLILGTINGMEIVCLEGRSHSYEGLDYTAVKTYVRTLRAIGCEYFFATNASGSLHQDIGPGELMLITDHINMQPGNPLVGPNDSEFGPRFFPLDNAYDLEMQAILLQVASKETIKLHKGVYISVLGPNYETAAEIRAFRILGADAVGMSTVPEVLVANHCGMKVAVIAIITNYATGLAATSHNHEAVMHAAANATNKLNTLLLGYIDAIQTIGDLTCLK